jgi:hypothetical protein
MSQAHGVAAPSRVEADVEAVLCACDGAAARIAVTDLSLPILTAAMLGSVVWDWGLGNPTEIRWHAITAVLLAITLSIRTLHRLRRLRTSDIR